MSYLSVVNINMILRKCVLVMYFGFNKKVRLSYYRLLNIFYFIEYWIGHENEEQYSMKGYKKQLK
jgi:hypothetical protein